MQTKRISLNYYDQTKLNVSSFESGINANNIIYNSSPIRISERECVIMKTVDDHKLIDSNNPNSEGNINDSKNKVSSIKQILS